MASFNQCIFVGNLARDPEANTTTGGTSVCNFTIACNSKYGDNEHCEWVRCVAFGKLADICNQYLEKGKQVMVVGRMQTRDWTDKEGVKRYTTEIILEKMTMLGGKSEGRSHEAPAGGSDGFDSDIPF